MSKEAQNLTSMDGIWEKLIDSKVRQEWEDLAVQTATDDPKIQTMVGLLPRCTGTVTSDHIRGQLGALLERDYDGVPLERRSEVLKKAASVFIQRENEAHGET